MPDDKDKIQDKTVANDKSNSDMPQDKLAKKSIAGQEDLEENERAEDKKERHAGE